MTPRRHVAAAAAALLFAAALPWPARAGDIAPIDANTASQAELERLPGLGVALSERWLAARAERPFRDWNDLRARVPGVGSGRAARWSRLGLRVAGAPYLGTSAASRSAD